MLALFQRNEFVHFAKVARGRGEPRSRCASHKCIGPHPILCHMDTVEQFGCKQILRPRLATCGRTFEKGQGGLHFALIVIKMSEAIGGLQMPLARRALVPICRRVEILFYAASKFIGLAQIELGIRIALFCRSIPFPHGLCKVARRPGIDTGFDIGCRRLCEKREARRECKCG